LFDKTHRFPRRESRMVIYFVHVLHFLYVSTGALVLLALAFLTPMFYFIPDAALAAVIIMAVVDLIDFSMVSQLWRISSE
jgi:hypothetical protein